VRRRRPEVGLTLALTLALTSVAALLAASCTGSGDTATTATGGSASSSTAGHAGTATTTARPPGTAPGRPRTFRHETRTLVDASRPTPAGSDTPGDPERTLVTDVYLPDVAEPAPLIAFSHGLTGHPDKFTGLLSAWAAAGYVVVAPAFPLTNDRVPGAGANARDLWQQPGDIRFVLDEVLAANEDPTDPLHGRIDPTRIGAGGLSLGGATTFGLGFAECCRDPRIRAVEVLAGNPIPLPTPYVFDSGLPLLIMHGDADPVLGLAAQQDVFVAARPPKVFVTLLGGSHAPPFEDVPSAHDELVPAVTVAFWDTYLAGDGDALHRLRAAATAPDLTELQVVTD
jgi:dienelactone hydrolase